MNETTTIETVQPTLFPLSALKTRGYAQPEPHIGADVEGAPEPVEDAA